MDINKILNADILDIIFEGKNKEYGAYELRKTYSARVRNAIVVTVGVCLVFFLSSFLFNGKKEKAAIIIEDVNLENMKQEEKKPEAPPPPPPPKPEPPKVEITKFTPPKIVPDKEVKEDEKPPEVEKLEETKIGTVNQEGKKDDGIVAAPVEVTTGGTEPVKQEEDYDKLFTSVQVESEYPGGAAAWKSYLERNLNTDAVKDQGAPAGRLTVEVTFTVDKEGRVSDISGNVVGGGESYGAVDEAIRVIKRSNSWKPGIQNGIQVKSIKKQKITFQINEE